MSLLDALIVFGFVVFSVTAGLVARRKASRGLEEFFLAGRGLRGWQAGTSMAATQFSADTPLLVTGLIATAGVFALWRLWIYGLAFLVLGLVFAGPWRRSGVITDAELTELRYGGRGVLSLRVLKAVYYGTLFNCIVIAWILLATTTIAEVLLPWHQWLPSAVYAPLSAMVGDLSTLASGATELPPRVAATNNALSLVVILAFIMLYSLTGGLRGVVATDIAQFALAIGGMVWYAGVVVDRVGGLSGLTARLDTDLGAETISFFPSARDLVVPFFTIVALQWFFQINADGSGYLAQRTMACKSDSDARIAGVLMAWLQVVVRSIPWIVIAVGLLVIYPISSGELADPGFAASREATFVRGIDELLPSGAKGLVITAMLAALASTLDTHLNWGASYWSNDVYQRLICQAWQQRTPSPRESVVVARLSNVLVLSLALLVLPYLDSIQQVWRISLLWGAGVGSVLVLRWLWERINVWSEFCAMTISLVCAPLLLVGRERSWFGGPSDATFDAVSIGTMALVSTIAAVLAAYVAPPTPPEALHEFYERVKPVGWWRQSALLAGDDPAAPRSAFVSAVFTTILVAVSLYGALYGVTRLLLPHPDVHPAFPIGALVLAAALVPWWRRRVASLR